MANQKLRMSGRPVNLHSALVEPDFRAPRVLCKNPWDYVSLWLKRDHQDDALFYWEQAKNFYNASLSLPELSSPLTSYYCILNATKALLTANSVKFKESHGVGGRSEGTKKSLENELVDFQGSGVLPSLCKFLGEKCSSDKEFTLKRIMWNIPFIHRAYCLTYSGSTELFIPLENSGFIRKKGTKQTWFQAEIHKMHVSSHTNKVIKPGYEIFQKEDHFELRRTKRFEWSGKDIEGSLNEFEKYHKGIRNKVVPIFSSKNRWYFKKNVSGSDEIENSQLVLIYAVMHRLSELSRYEPVSLNKHFNTNHNWLLSEFIKNSPNQFVYGIASEITGLEFIKPDAF